MKFLVSLMLAGATVLSVSSCAPSSVSQVNSKSCATARVGLDKFSAGVTNLSDYLKSNKSMNATQSALAKNQLINLGVMVGDIVAVDGTQEFLAVKSSLTSALMNSLSVYSKRLNGESVSSTNEQAALDKASEAFDKFCAGK